MPSTALFATATQTRSLSPSLQRAVQLLQMSALDFAQQIDAAVGSNPFLEGDTADDRVAAGPATGDPVAADPGGTDLSLAAANETATDAAGWQNAAGWQDADRSGVWNHGGAALRHHPDDDGEPARDGFDTLAAEPSLAAHLHAQLGLTSLPARDLALARAVADSLDDDGYLRIDLEELCGVVGLDPVASAAEWRIALCRVQSLEPAGVAARTVQECLRLQLPAIGCPEQRALARDIVERHLDALAANDVATIARCLGRTLADVDAACRRIRRLHPRPGWRHDGARVDYLRPDVIARKRRGVWQVSLNPAVVPKVRVNRAYAELFRRHRGGAGAALAEQLREAQWTVRNVDQRLETIRGVAQAIVERQTRFLDYGAMAMRPLGLREIAAAVGVHESTVSRATSNKYLATPSGVFELKHFFSRELPAAAGNSCSNTALRSLIGSMIAAESPAAPLSDAEIARQLAGQGLTLARRTVTKYRQLLRIAAVERRRRYA